MCSLVCGGLQFLRVSSTFWNQRFSAQNFLCRNVLSLVRSGVVTFWRRRKIICFFCTRYELFFLTNFSVESFVIGDWPVSPDECRTNTCICSRVRGLWDTFTFKLSLRIKTNNILTNWTQKKNRIRTWKSNYEIFNGAEIQRPLITKLFGFSGLFAQISNKPNVIKRLMFYWKISGQTYNVQAICTRWKRFPDFSP